MQPPWIDNLPLFNGTGQKTPTLTWKVGSACRKDSSHGGAQCLQRKALYILYLTVSQATLWVRHRGEKTSTKGLNAPFLSVFISAESLTHSTNPYWAPPLGKASSRPLNYSSTWMVGIILPFGWVSYPHSEPWPRLALALFFSGWSSEHRPTFAFYSSIGHFLECIDLFQEYNMLFYAWGIGNGSTQTRSQSHLNTDLLLKCFRRVTQFLRAGMAYSFSWSRNRAQLVRWPVSRAW